MQANSTKEFSDHATKSQSQKIQGEGSDNEGLSESPSSVGGAGNSSVDKQTVVDHMTTRFARDPNDLRSRIMERHSSNDADAFHQRLNNEDRRLTFSDMSKGVPSGSRESKQFVKEPGQGTIPTVGLPLGKQVPIASNLPNRTEPWIQLKQEGSSKAAEELSHNHKDQNALPSQFPNQ